MAVEVESSGATVDEAAPAEPTPPPFDFSFNDFLKREYRFGISSDRPFCKPFLQGFCPLGSSCPDKHYSTPSYNAYVTAPYQNNILD
jgi:cleavage and polyadenylation specificity factor subunit 4